MLKYVILGLSHPHARDLGRGLFAFPDEAVCLGAADTPSHDDQDVDEKIRINLASFYDSLKLYDDYRELIALKPDFAIVCCDNADCAKISLECINAGINVVLEKPMTSSYADAELVVTAAEKAGVKIVINWPIAGFHPFNKAKELADEGRIGKVMRVVYRSPATWGPFSYSNGGVNPPVEEMGKTWWYRRERGGGSILDYACYGTAISTWIFGKRAQRVHTVAKNFCLPGLDVEDFAAVMLDFGDGVGLLDGSWSTFNPGEIPSGPVIYGTEGTIVCDRHLNAVKIYEGHSHKHVLPTEVIECPPIEELSFARDLIDHLTKEKPIHPLRAPKFNLDVMYALDQALKSAKNQ